MSQANSVTESVFTGGSCVLDTKDTEMTKTQASPSKKPQSSRVDMGGYFQHCDTKNTTFFPDSNFIPAS